MNGKLPRWSMSTMIRRDMSIAFNYMLVHQTQIIFYADPDQYYADPGPNWSNCFAKEDELGLTLREEP